MSAEKSNVETSLITYDDVAAGLINAIFAEGRDFVAPDELRNAPLNSAYEASGRLREQRRDVAKYLVRNGRCECVFAFEVQSKVEPNMPVRVFGYDGSTYRDELDNAAFAEQFDIGADRVAPVFTTVLYFGDAPWRNNRKLSERATMSDDVARVMRPYFKDFEIQVVDFAGLSDEELRKYPEDIRFIAGYFRCKRNGWGLNELRELQRGKFTHLREMAYFLDYVVKDARFAYETIMKGCKKEPKNMCELLDRIIAEGAAEKKAEWIAEGIAEGEVEGEIKAKKAMAIK
ncbi:MAG: Rpn family recombination-promoting nuclease/putative transposase, partial [Thermoguttaceae bacterium]|nr:Rpn family recombination-promoting nuclease/putative transposase [Thermoguttaceae bacterium]